MINRLINMDISIPNKGNLPSMMASNPGNYTIQQYVSAFLSGLGETQKDRFKQMLKNGIQSGMSIAKSYGIEYSDFIKEVKKQLNLEV